MDSSWLVPVVMGRWGVEGGLGAGCAGWPCVKVNVKGLFVSAQRPMVREGDGPECSPGLAALLPR